MKTAWIGVFLVLGSFLWNEAVSTSAGKYLYIPAERDLTAEAHFLERRVRAVDNTTFNYQWVSQCGYGPSQIEHGPSIEVSATLTVSYNILEKTARLVHLVTRFMPRQLFQSLSQNFSVGVFVFRQDVPSIFPEYTHKKDTPGCQAWCLGECSPTCVENNAKFDGVFSHSGPRILVVEQNMNCDRDIFGDPQFGWLNLLVTEMAKNVVKSLPKDIKDMLTLAYENAQLNRLWTDSIAMNSVENYFVQGSLAWFTSTKLTDFTTGGMNYCGERICGSEESARDNIRQVDSGLFKILTQVYNNGREYIQGRVTVCNW